MGRKRKSRALTERLLGSLIPPLTVLICWWGPGIPNVKALQMILMVLRDGNYCSLIMTANLGAAFEVLLPRRKEGEENRPVAGSDRGSKLIHNFKSFGNLSKFRVQDMPRQLNNNPLEVGHRLSSFEALQVIPTCRQV